MRVIRGLAMGAVAAVAVGVVIGGAARLLMRLVALAADHESEFTWGATAGILALFGMAMLPGALIAGVTTHWLRWLLAIAGAVTLVLPAVAISSEDLGSTAGLSAMQWIGVAAATVAIFAAIGIAPWVTVRLVDRLVGRSA